MAHRLAWVAVALVGLFVFAWPQVSGAVLLSDDTQLLFAHLPEPRYYHGWNSPTGFFRPIEIVSALLVNPDGRDARMSLLLHVPAVGAILAAMFVALRRTTSLWRLAFPLAVLWWLLNVGTAIALWQPDVISQSWSGAIGAWTALLAWIGIDKVRQGRLDRTHLAAFIALCIAGVFTKEFYVGWSAGIIVMLGIAYLSSSSAERRHVLQWLAMPIPLATVALAFVVLRLATGALAPSGGEGRYDLGFGLNVVENVVISAAGLLAVGPSHLISAPDASLVARVSAPIGAFLTAVFLAAAAGLVAVQRRIRWEKGRVRSDQRMNWEIPVYGVILSFAAVGPSLVTHHVSEYYLFGPNAIVACFVGFALATLWTRGRQTRWVALVLGTMAVMWAGIALFGAVARADGIRVHWQQVRIMDEEVNRIITDAQGDEATHVRIFFSEEMAAGPRHGVFYSTPTHLYDLPLSSMFLSEYVGGIRVELLVGAPPTGSESLDVQLEVRLPTRRVW